MSKLRKFNKGKFGNFSKPNQKSDKTSWGGVSEWYDNYLEENADSYQEKVIWPNLLRIISPKAPMKILDLACGQGFFSRKLASLGVHVIGADISKELIEKAVARSPEIKFVVTPAHNLNFAKREYFDVVLCVLAIQNIQNISDVFSEVQKVLKKGGKFILVLNHPAFRIPQRSSWGFDEKNNIQYRRIDGYMSSKTIEIDMNPGKFKKNKTLSYHRSLQDFFKTFSKNGFIVSGLEEWVSHKKSQKGGRGRAEDVSRKEIPLFMMLEATKN
jgi:ubiquinone/menaquinone biosynthesis C-methylase UbiE